MSRRALALLALLAIGNAEALAVNAPQAVEPRGAEPQEDLFATRPETAVPAPPPVQPAAVPPSAAATPAQPAATTPAQPDLTTNPLWGIPLDGLTAARERPLFAPTRRPAPVAAALQPVAAPPPPPPKPVEPEKPQLSLLGTVAGEREKIGLFIDSVTKVVLRLKTGENHKGWTLRGVTAHEAELAKGLDTTVLAMPTPDMKAGGAPPPPTPVSMPATAAPVPAISGNPPLPVQARGTPGMIPSPNGPAPSGATIVVRPPVFEQPSAPTNPFQQAGPFPRMK
jgi:general secretion pathway protein N